MSSFLEVSDLVFSYQVKNFEPIKQTIMSQIGEMEVRPYKSTTSQIYNTDYHIQIDSERPQDIYRPYLETVGPLIRQHSEFMAEQVDCDEYVVSNCWFQQYRQDDHHSVHVHPHCMFSNILYVEFPSNSSRTTFYYKDGEYEFPVDEGTIITFPSFFKHESKPNKSSQKTIISYNSSIVR